MELSAKLLHDVEFKERWRGYDPDEVDAFLEQVARGVEALQERVREVERTDRAGRNGRVDRPEAREAPREVREPAREPQRDVGTEDELRRVLVLAQRTADTAVREARDEADRLLAQAREHAEQVTATADAYGARVRREADEDVARRVQAAEAEVAAAGAGALQQLNDEVAGLESRRDELQAVVALAGEHLSEHRTRAQVALEQLQRLVDDPASLGAVPMAPVVAAAAVQPDADAEADDEADLLDPELEGDELAWDEYDDEVEEDDDAEAAVPLDEADEADELDDLDGSGELDADDELDVDADEAAGDDDDADEPAVIDLAEAPALLDAGSSTGELFLGLDDVPSVAWGAEGGVRADLGGPATQAMAPVPEVDDVDEDAYLAELRQAIAADESLSPAAEAFFTQAAYEDDRWKGLRRRR